nr:transposase [Kitasatospora cineracea]
MGPDRAAAAGLAGAVAWPAPRGRPALLQGILSALYTGITWQQLPPEVGFGSGQTCWRRLGRWQKAGVFEALYRMLLAELSTVGLIDWTRACVDATHVRAKKGGPLPASPATTPSDAPAAD